VVFLRSSCSRTRLATGCLLYARSKRHHRYAFGEPTQACTWFGGRYQRRRPPQLSSFAIALQSKVNNVVQYFVLDCIVFQRKRCLRDRKRCTAPEASWRRVCDPCTPLLFDLYHYLEQKRYFWLVPEHAPGPSSQVLPGCRVRHPCYSRRVLKDFRWFVRHLSSKVKSAALKKSSYLQVLGSIPAENTSSQIHMDLSK